MPYHRRFQRIRPFVVERTRYLIKNWRRYDEETRWAGMLALVIMLSCDERGYGGRGFKTPAVVRNEHAGHGFYNQLTNEIHMSYPSIITLLHEFRHAMQHQRCAGDWRDAEDDARGWSLSLYYLAAPRTLERLVREGRVLHTTIADFEVAE